jgi:hypothetical protein
VAEVEIGLGTVLGHEHLAVLVRRHRAGIDVDVGVELLQGDPKAAGYQELSDGRCRDALTERGDDSPGDEDEAGAGASDRHID